MSHSAGGSRLGNVHREYTWFSTLLLCPAGIRYQGKLRLLWCCPPGIHDLYFTWTNLTEPKQDYWDDRLPEETCLSIRSELMFKSGECLFCRNFAKLVGLPNIWDNVLNTFCWFYIEIAYLNFYFLWCRCRYAQFSSTPHNFSKTSTPKSSGFARQNAVFLQSYFLDGTFNL